MDSLKSSLKCEFSVQYSPIPCTVIVTHKIRLQRFREYSSAQTLPPLCTHSLPAQGQKSRLLQLLLSCCYYIFSRTRPHSQPESLELRISFLPVNTYYVHPLILQDAPPIHPFTTLFRFKKWPCQAGSFYQA